uniref:BZIP domain-containing protein n=1 Tax=Globisporangium ultimum (strain ATCC 200006 / CBS 805.95 / DAOM BR144) TaxID=431595 RepID=K3WNT9_GLOUD
MLTRGHPNDSDGSTSDANSSDDAQPLVVARLKNPKKTNSDRGKEFRAKRKQYEVALMDLVGSLRKEVDDLQFLRQVRHETMLKSRNSLTGSLVRVVREYYMLFQYGMQTAVPPGHKRLVSSDASESFQQRQVTFLNSAMDPEVQIGATKGVESLVEQWKRYTAYHSALRTDVLNVEISGPEESPMIVVNLHLHVRFSRETFKHVFPHVADNEELVQRFIGKDVTYVGVNQYQFSKDGRISVYDSDVSFASALIDAGASPRDIALLMNEAKITDNFALGKDGDEMNGNNSEEAEGEQRVGELLPDESEGTDTESPRIEEDESADLTNNVAARPPLRVTDLLSDDSECNNKGEGRSNPKRTKPLETGSSRLAVDFLLS